MGPRPRGRGIRAAAQAVPTRIKASMGPRPRGRGIPLDLKLAWLLQCRASMGPRPRGRGIILLADILPFFPDASMGPRPRGRGINWLFSFVSPLGTLQW